MPYNLTKEQALFIKDLRVNKDYTWRAVAKSFTDAFPDIESSTENQMIGVQLCYSAMKLLGEEINDGWN